MQALHFYYAYWECYNDALGPFSRKRSHMLIIYSHVSASLAATKIESAVCYGGVQERRWGGEKEVG